MANRKQKKKIMTVGVPNETRTRYLPHTSLNHHRYTNQPDRQGQVMSKDNQRRDFIVVKAEPDDKRPGIYVFVATDPVALSTWCVQVPRSPNLFKKNYSPQEAENAVISQRNHPVDIHIFHNAHATIA